MKSTQTRQWFVGCHFVSFLRWAGLSAKRITARGCSGSFPGFKPLIPARLCASASLSFYETETEADSVCSLCSHFTECPEENKSVSKMIWSVTRYVEVMFPFWAFQPSRISLWRRLWKPTHNRVVESTASLRFPQSPSHLVPHLKNKKQQRCVGGSRSKLKYKAQTLCTFPHCPIQSNSCFFTALLLFFNVYDPCWREYFTACSLYFDPRTI